MKLSRSQIPPYMESEQVACIGGCDEDLNNVLGVRFVFKLCFFLVLYLLISMNSLITSFLAAQLFQELFCNTSFGF